MCDHWEGQLQDHDVILCEQSGSKQKAGSEARSTAKSSTSFCKALQLFKHSPTSQGSSVRPISPWDGGVKSHLWRLPGGQLAVRKTSTVPGACYSGGSILVWPFWSPRKTPPPTHRACSPCSKGGHTAEGAERVLAYKPAAQRQCRLRPHHIHNTLAVND